MNNIESYNQKQQGEHQEICLMLQKLLSNGLPEAESKVWHGHPVWFLDGNPTVGYSVEKRGVRLMFWSGRSFHEPELVGDSKFKDASIFYNAVSEIDEASVRRWLEKSRTIQWDYKNIVKRRGELIRLP
ncbi:MAG: DUF1801 domain-containing protein [Candidatus Saccharibacteria bacterium]|nr:DUF1801 domain-containing protein [Candidatus Saccharibacteria bacterium]